MVFRAPVDDRTFLRVESNLSTPCGISNAFVIFQPIPAHRVGDGNCVFFSFIIGFHINFPKAFLPCMFKSGLCCGGGGGAHRNNAPRKSKEWRLR
jgi:hypothetical protein